MDTAKPTRLDRDAAMLLLRQHRAGAHPRLSPAELRSLNETASAWDADLRIARATLARARAAIAAAQAGRTR